MRGTVMHSALCVPPRDSRPPVLTWWEMGKLGVYWFLLISQMVLTGIKSVSVSITFGTFSGCVSKNCEVNFIDRRLSYTHKRSPVPSLGESMIAFHFNKIPQALFDHFALGHSSLTFYIQ